MKKTFYFSVVSLLVLCVLSLRYFSGLKTLEKGDRLLLPVKVEEIKTDAFSSSARIRYYNFIPVDALMKESGTVVVRYSDNTRIEFVSKEKDRKLRPREFLLKYTIVPPPLLKKENAEPNIRFAASGIRFSKDKKISYLSICYAVVYVTASGETFLSGLADCNGTELVKSLIYPENRTL